MSHQSEHSEPRDSSHSGEHHGKHEHDDEHGDKHIDQHRQWKKKLHEMKEVCKESAHRLCTPEGEDKPAGGPIDILACLYLERVNVDPVCIDKVEQLIPAQFECSVDLQQLTCLDKEHAVRDGNHHKEHDDRKHGGKKHGGKRHKRKGDMKAWKRKVECIENAVPNFSDVCHNALEKQGVGTSFEAAELLAGPSPEQHESETHWMHRRFVFGTVVVGVVLLFVLACLGYRRRKRRREQQRINQQINQAFAEPAPVVIARPMAVQQPQQPQQAQQAQQAQQPYQQFLVAMPVAPGPSAPPAPGVVMPTPPAYTPAQGQYQPPGLYPAIY